MKNKIILTLILTFLIPLAVAEPGCFFLEESPFHCTDVSREQATEECLLFDGCILETNFLNDQCDNILTCKGVLEGIPEKNNSSLLVIISVLFFAAATFFAFKAGLFKKIMDWIYKPLPQVPQQESEFWKVFSPYSSNKKVKSRIWKLKSKHHHKLKEHERKSFFNEIGLAMPEKKEDQFTKLSKIYKYYEKHKLRIAKELSKKERKVFQNLEQVVEFNEKKNTFNREKIPQEDDLHKLFDDLRKIAKK